MDGDRSDLTDEVLREEIELVGQLVLAATASPGRMCQEEVDSILGVVPGVRLQAAAGVLAQAGTVRGRFGPLKVTVA